MAKALSDYIRQRFAEERLDSSLPLLRLLFRRGPLSQGAAAAELAITPGACNLHCQRLEHAGLLHRADTVRHGKGRPTIVWDIDHRRNACILFVCDVPFMRGALVDFTGAVLLEERMDLSAATDQAQVLDAMDGFLDQADRLARRDGVTIRQAVGGFPGLADPVDGTIRQAVNLPVLDGLPFVRHLARRGVPARTVSLSLCFLFGEIAGLPEHETAAVVHWDLGVGIICGHGDRVLSIQAAADGPGEIIEAGHICVERDGRRCQCGRRGCLEAYAGGRAMLAAWHRRCARLPAFIAALQDRQPEACAAAAPAAFALGRNLAWPIQWTAAGRIIVTGPLSAAFEVLEPGLRRGLGEALPAARLRHLPVCASGNPEQNLRRGAFRLALRLFLDPASAGQLPRSPARMA